MSIPSVGSSPVLQWLQTYLSGAGSSTGSQRACGCQSSGDRTSFSKEAAQLNASQASQNTDPSQPSGVSGSQGHHHHHHHHGCGQDGNPFINQLAQSIVTDLQQATGSDASTGAGASTPGSASSSATGGSFIDKLAQSIANDLLSNYQQTTGGSTATSQSGTSSHINSFA